MQISPAPSPSPTTQHPCWKDRDSELQELPGILAPREEVPILGSGSSRTRTEALSRQLPGFASPEAEAKWRSLPLFAFCGLCGAI